jgi:hypothetical protein
MFNFAHIKQNLYRTPRNTLKLLGAHPKSHIKGLKRLDNIENVKSFLSTTMTVYQSRVNSQQVRYLSTTRVLNKEREPKDESLEEATHNNNNNNNNKQDDLFKKPVVPEVYPQLLALPISRRPLFPGFYKAVVIKDPQVTAAIKELFKKGQPYVGAFLTKDDELDIDKITHLDQVYPIGVFAQITSIFPASAGNGQSDTDPGLTAVLYPHRRIQLNGIIGKDDASFHDKKTNLTDSNKGNIC